MQDPTSSFIAFAHARPEISKCNLRIGIQETTFDKLSADAASAIIKQLSMVSQLTDSGTARLMQAIVDGPCRDFDKKSVVTAINPKVPEDVCRQTLQQREHVFNYLSASDWVVIMDGSAMRVKMDKLTRRCASLCLMNQTERTFSALVSVLMCGDQFSSVCVCC